MRRFKFEPLWALGGATVSALVAAWLLGYLPTPEKPIDAFSLVVTALATAVVAWWTVTLGQVGRQQVEDTRILQRAYLSANIAGVSPFRTIEERKGHIVVAHVDIKNVGHLPARRVSCSIKIMQSENGALADFPINEQDFFGSYVLTPGAVTRQGSNRITLAEGGWVYVWGRVKYLDGFGQQRTTDFCHRYPRIMLRLFDSGGHGIPAEFGRFHDVGNSTDEDQM
jgi:hypothetical protein